MASKYVVSNRPSLNKSFERLAAHTQGGVSTSRLSMHELLMLCMDDSMQVPGESFVQWLAGHFQLTSTEVHDIDTRALRDVLIPEYRTPADILALQTNPPWPGEMSEERLTSLTEAGKSVGSAVLAESQLSD